MVATAGSKLTSDEAISTLKEMLIPLADVITPNIPEMEVLSGMAIQSAQDMERAAKETGDAYHCAVLRKGGHQLNDANDLYTRMVNISGSTGNGLQLPIPMAPAVRCPALLLQIWQRGAVLRSRWAGRKRIYPARSVICWIWAREADP